MKPPLPVHGEVELGVRLAQETWAGVKMGSAGEVAEDTLLLVSGGAVLGSLWPHGFNVIFNTQLIYMPFLKSLCYQLYSSSTQGCFFPLVFFHPWLKILIEGMKMGKISSFLHYVISKGNLDYQ